MRQHDEERNAGADSGRESRAENAHVTGEDEEIITEDIENTASQDAERRKPRIAVVPQEGREHLVEQEQRENESDWPHVFLCQRKQRFVRTEERQDRALKEQKSDPRQNSQRNRADHGGGKILVLISAALCAAALRAENNAAADAHEKTETIYNVPDRRDDGQRRRALRDVVLPDHRSIDNRIDRGDHGAAERGREVFEIHRPDLTAQKIHGNFLLLHEKSRTGNRRLSLSLVRLLFLRNSPPSERTWGIVAHGCGKVNRGLFRVPDARPIR